MRSSVMTHGVASISEFEYKPHNGHSVSFTLTGVDGSHTEYTLWGLTPEKASEFYERNTQVQASARVKELEEEVKNLKAALSMVANHPDARTVAVRELERLYPVPF